MRRLRIFFVELILVGILVAWIFEKFPSAVDRFIPWIGFAILRHLTVEIIFDAERTKKMARIACQRLGRMVWIVAFCIGGLISIAYLYTVRAGLSAAASTRSPGSQESSPSQQNLRLRIDRLVPLYTFRHLPAGLPVVVPPAAPPTDKNPDTYVVVVGTILNDRDIPATAAYWEMSAKLANGRAVSIELIVPVADIFINYPNSPPNTIHMQDYWPRKLDTRSIPPHAVSYGFVLGVIKGVKFTDFDQPNTSVTVCFQDSSGQRICDVIHQEDRSKI